MTWRVRRALSMAIDRQRMVDTVFEGHGLLAAASPGFYYQDASRREGSRPLVPVPTGRGQSCSRRRPPERLRDHAVLLRVLAPDVLQVPARQQELKKNLNVNMKISKPRLHDLLRRYVEGKWDGMELGFQSATRWPRRAAYVVHALEVLERTSTASMTPSSTS